MRKSQVIVLRAAGGLAGGVLAASVWAQPPAPRPLPATGPAPSIVCEPGPIRRAAHHTWGVLQDNFIGYPEYFAEPPVGFYNSEIIGVMRAKAATHRFILYRSDFLDKSTQFSPIGAGRFNLMAPRLRSWLGPIQVEWSPDEPGLAEARRLAVIDVLRQGGQPVIPERVVIGPSPYPGSLGNDADTSFSSRLARGAQAGQSLPAISGAASGGR